MDGNNQRIGPRFKYSRYPPHVVDLTNCADWACVFMGTTFRLGGFNSSISVFRSGSTTLSSGSTRRLGNEYVLTHGRAFVEEVTRSREVFREWIDDRLAPRLFGMRLSLPLFGLPSPFWVVGVEKTPPQEEVRDWDGDVKHLKKLNPFLLSYSPM